MAGAARPSPRGDGSIPCPFCGGLVHPVAGRCKHCKEDLAARRIGRASAATPLPSLHVGGSSPVVGPMPSVIANAYAPVREASTPVLPPRQTGRSYAAQSASTRSWKSWPMLVIVLASIAIVVAVVMMVWPPSQADAGRHVAQPPAPERMETDPLPPAGAGNTNGADPWGGHSQADPKPRQTPDQIPNTPPPPNAAQPDPTGPDPFAGIGQLGGVAGADMMMAAAAHACIKMKSCPNADDLMTQICETVTMFPQTAPPNCDAGKRCLDAIDKMDCDADMSNTSPLTLANQFQDCIKAATSC